LFPVVNFLKCVAFAYGDIDYWERIGLLLQSEIQWAKRRRCEENDTNDRDIATLDFFRRRQWTIDRWWSI